MAPKHSLDAAMSSSPVAKRARLSTTIVKQSHRANFDRLCALHDWTPSEAIHEKLAALLQLSGKRLEASELLPLAFVQHYPFIWVKDFLLLGYNHAGESVWYKAYPTGRGLARGRYYNSAQVNILGKHTVAKYWQSWVDVFDIEQRALDRSHEYFTGVYLILKKFPNLRYKPGRNKEDARDPQNAIRTTGVAEYPFNDDHPFMQQETSEDTNNVENNETQQAFDAETEIVDNASFIKQEQTDLHDQDLSVPLARQLLTQLTSRPNLRLFDQVSTPKPQGHTANDQQGPPVNADGSVSPVRRLSVQSDSRAHSRILDSVYPSRSQISLTDDRTGLPENGNSLTSLPGPLSEQSTSRANSRHSMSMFISHSPERPMDKQSLVQDDTGVTSFPRQLSKQPVFRAYSRELAPPSLSQFDKNTADKSTGLYIREAASLLDQTSKNSSFCSSSLVNLTTSSHPTRPTLEKQVGRRIEDNLEAPVSQQSPKTPTSRGTSRNPKKITSPYFARTRSQPTQPKILDLPRCDSKPSSPTQKFTEYTIRVPVEIRWSNTNFKFTAVTSVATIPAPDIQSIEE
ncbi:hypothetical protein KCU81_g5080, partial [Aureobasidium melanogenum]|uniref:Uncharacterized protein n=1 Tax=Aureobasidium melanogenum (strain CBS 110374) TaxID=1043003 RepID=A0A074VE36_AURM1